VRTLAAALLTAIALAGCGGDGEDAAEPDTTVPATATPTESDAAAGDRAAYVAEADALCADVASRPEAQKVAEGAQELQALGEDNPRFFQQAAAHFGNVLELARSFAEDFRALEPPPEEAERVEQFHGANDDAIARLEEVVDALEARDESAVEVAFEDYGAALAKADRLAEAYGFEVCARTGGAAGTGG
jgi:hypothetical protein